MIDDEKVIRKKVENTLYVHDCFSSMFYGMLNWFQTEFDTRFAYKVISTYDKAVQFFKSKKASKDGMIQTNILPSMTLDPNLDFVNEERSGRFPWMFPNLDSLSRRPFAKKIRLLDQGVTISIMHTRYSGTCDITFWLSSIYELMDFRSKIIQYCGGIGRWIRPEFFWSHMILPKDIAEFKRPTDGQPLDWSATPVELIQLKTTNTKEYAVPYPINAIWRLDSLSDGSTKYGGDQLTEWRFVASFTWEANIPTYVRLDNYTFYNMKPTLNIHISPTYASQPLLNKIPMVCSLRQDDVLRKIIKSNTIYTVDNTDIASNGENDEVTKVKASPFVKFDESQCDHYPQSYVPWDHVKSGMLVDEEYLQNNPDYLQNQNDLILLLKHYNSDIHDDYIRRCCACLCCFDDISSEFYTKVSSMGTSTICNFDERLYDSLKNQIGNDFTIDSIARLIYKGKYKSKFLEYNDIIDRDYYDVCNNLLDIIKNQSSSKYNDSEYKRLSFGQSTITYYDKKESLGILKPNQKVIELPRLINSEIANNCKIFMNNKCLPKDWYEISNKFITFNEKAKLDEYSTIEIQYNGLTKILDLEPIINYIMTKSDEREYFVNNKKITIELPDDYDHEYIECYSYNGQLDRNVDFEIKDNNIIFKMEPMREKIIQIFANRNYN